MRWPRVSGPDLELRRPTGISLLGLLDLPLPDQAFPSPGDVALLTARDIVEGCAVVLLTVVLGAIASYTTEATPSHAPTVLSSVIILIAFKALSDIAASIKKLTVMEFTVY